MTIYLRAFLFSLLMVSIAGATAMEELNYWRTQNGLPALKEDKELTKFAQNKAEWRAQRLAQNGHQGPSCPGGCREGCGEATSTWGWLTCCQEETGTYAGAGVAIGRDGQRYMVLVMRGTHGSTPKGRQIGGRGARMRIIDTSHLTPDAPRVDAAGNITVPVVKSKARETQEERTAAKPVIESPVQRDARMKWWREARFGLFIHWGLYAIPAGEWDGKTNHAEWIRTTAQIPLEEYDQFVGQFNPVKFDADAWARMAKQAGMKYIVITSKHHDGFCLWPSEQTEFDVAATPIGRDIMGELKAACDKHGLKFCMYHSIMDWHHPDYLPRRDWEQNRDSEGADYERYVVFMKAQLKELVESYDPAVLWFDGEWEGTWTHEHGIALDDYMRSLKPDIIVNNRVDKGRKGMEGLTKEGDFRGDFGTPEQEIPGTGVPGMDWESCMTMNRHWGYNKADNQYKSTRDLVRKLIDIASKGGNFLLNIGPTAEGEFPPESVERLAEIGKWMETNCEAIYGTSASPCDAPEWGRITQKGRHLYLHVFDWPTDGQLNVPLTGEVKSCSLLAAPERKLDVTKSDVGLVVQLSGEAVSPIATVIDLVFVGELQAMKSAPDE